MNLRFLSILILIAISEAGFIQDHQNIFYSHSDPVSYQSFVSSYDKFPTSDHNAVDVHQSIRTRTKPDQLFKPADYAEQAAYQEEVELAHRFALTNRHNSSNAAYVEAYNEAVKSQRKGETVGEAPDSYISDLLRYKFALNSDHATHLTSSQKGRDLNEADIYLAGNHEIGKSVDYFGAPDYKFNVIGGSGSGGVVQRQTYNIVKFGSPSTVTFA